MRQSFSTMAIGTKPSLLRQSMRFRATSLAVSHGSPSLGWQPPQWVGRKFVNYTLTYDQLTMFIRRSLCTRPGGQPSISDVSKSFDAKLPQALLTYFCHSQLPESYGPGRCQSWSRAAKCSCRASRLRRRRGHSGQFRHTLSITFYTNAVFACQVLVFMAVTSAMSAELIAVSTICTYDIYKAYINPKATSKQLIRTSHISCVVYSICLAAFSTGLYYAGIR